LQQNDPMAVRGLLQSEVHWHVVRLAMEPEPPDVGYDHLIGLDSQSLSRFNACVLIEIIGPAVNP